MGQAICFVQISFIKFATVSHKLDQGDRGKALAKSLAGFCWGLRRPASDQVLPGLCKLPGWGKSTTAFILLWLAGPPTLDQWEGRKVREQDTWTGWLYPPGHPPTFSVRYKTLPRSQLGEIRGGSERQSPASPGPHIRLAGARVTSAACCRLGSLCCIPGSIKWAAAW